MVRVRRPLERVIAPARRTSWSRMRAERAQDKDGGAGGRGTARFRLGAQLKLATEIVGEHRGQGMT